MKISIVIPVYNVEEYVVDCLNSVASQTWNGDVEVLIVDDCGNDDSMKKVEAFVSGYKGNQQYRIVRNERNLGISMARNNGISAATGTHLFLLDSDDMISPECLEFLVETEALHPGVDLVDAGVTVIPEGRHVMPSNGQLPDYDDDRNAIVRNMLACRYTDTAWNKLIRLDFLRENDLYFKPGVLNEDGEWLYRLSTRLRSIAICRQNTYVYRYNPIGITASALRSDRDVVSRIKNLDANIDDIRAPYASIQRRYILNNIFILLQHMKDDGHKDEYLAVRDRFADVCPTSWLVRKLLGFYSRCGNRHLKKATSFTLKILVSL